MGACLIAAFAIMAPACGGNAFEAAAVGDAALDGPTGDTTVHDAKLDAPRDSADGADAPSPPPDAATDAPIPPPDSTNTDVIPDRVDAAADAVADVVTVDSPTCDPTTCPPVTLQCLPNSAATGSGLSISSYFYVAWRFQAPTGRTLTTSEVGALMWLSVPGGTIFAAIIPMSGPTMTLKATLTASDVLGSAIIPLDPMNAAARVYSANLSVTLTPGAWYAVAFGTAQLGASGADANIVNLNPNGCENGEPLLSVRVTGENISQAAGGYLYVLAQ